MGLDGAARGVWDKLNLTRLGDSLKPQVMHHKIPLVILSDVAERLLEQFLIRVQLVLE